MNDSSQLEKNINASVEISIRLLFLFIMIGVCLTILSPFLSPVLWGIIIAVSIAPVYDSLVTRIKSSWAATIIVLVMLAIIIVPSFIMVSSLSDSVRDIIENYQDGSLDIPPPSEEVAEWPLIGEDVYSSWKLASENIEDAVIKYDKQLKDLGGWLLNTASGIAAGVFQFIFSIIIAGVLLATKGTKNLSQQLFIKLVGTKRGAEFADMAEQTIQSVTKGILGVAIIQSIAMGIILFLAGVPYAEIWALIVLIMAIIQIPVTLITIPIIGWLFSNLSPGAATLWTVLVLLGSLIDNVLKPILLGKGAPVPMIVIFLGAIGGFISMGFIGLFTGAIVLSVGYRLFIAWIEEAPQTESPAPKSIE